MTIKNVKSAVTTALKGVQRDGMMKLLSWLSQSDFFTAPASTNNHGNYEGGLIEHSWNVYDLLVKKNEQFQTQYLADTLVICGLLHDVCKVNMYDESSEEATDAQMFRLKKEFAKNKHVPSDKLTKQYASDLIGWYANGMKGDMPAYKPGYKVNDQFPVGHGEKSVILLQQYIKLTEEEIYAIRWHMGPFEIGINFGFPTGYAFQNIWNRLPLVAMLFTADTEATIVLEGNK